MARMNVALQELGHAVSARGSAGAGGGAGRGQRAGSGAGGGGHRRGGRVVGEGDRRGPGQRRARELEGSRSWTG